MAEEKSITPDQARIIEEYTETLRRKLTANLETLNPTTEVFGEDGHVIRWMGAEIARGMGDAPNVVKTGRRIKRDMAYFSLSL